MNRPVFHLVYSYRSGLGVELARTSAAIKRMESTHQVCITSFHSFMYDGRFRLYPLSETAAPQWMACMGDTGICFSCDERPNGPFAWGSLVARAKAHGWMIIPEDIDPGEPQLYTAALNLTRRLSLALDNQTQRSILAHHAQRADHFVLNLFGGASPQKGLTHPKAVSHLTGLLGRMLPGIKWLIPRLPHQCHYGPLTPDLGPNFQLVTFPYEDRSLTELFYCRGVVTVEGGGLHVAVEQGSPTLLRTSKSWLEAVANLLPPSGSYHVALTDLGSADQNSAAACIASWVGGLPANIDAPFSRGDGISHGPDEGD